MMMLLSNARRKSLRRFFCAGLGLALLTFMPFGAASGQGTTSAAGGAKPMREVRLITLDPGHFHAGLIQKEMYPEVSPQVVVYAPLGFDLIEHLNRVARFNTRAERPTDWRLEIHTGPDFMERMLKERPGNVVVLSGRNRGKIDRIKASVEAGLNVLADKPWIITAADLPKLQSALETAAARGLVAYDIMTERYEVTSALQKELVRDEATFGTLAKGSEAEPAVYMESIHYLMKTVAGVPNIRPTWFFDTEQQGEGFADIGTHLVDLVQWTLFPDQLIDYRQDVQVISAERWPTLLTKEEFRRVTGAAEFPDFLAARLEGGKLAYYCNTTASYAVRGVHAKMKVVWNYEAPEGGDTHFAVYRGSRARVEVRQGRAERYRPELYVVPNAAAEKATVMAGLRKKIESLKTQYPGLAVEETEKEARVLIPDRYRNGHEAHFAQVTDQFLRYFRDPRAMPRWEQANMLTKYYITTKGVELSRQNTRRAPEMSAR